MAFSSTILPIAAILLLGQGASTQLIDVERDVTFHLFTQQNVNEYQLITSDAENLTNSNFDLTKDTKFITHGFLNNGSGSSVIEIKDAFLNHHDVNIIIVDYTRIALDIIITQPVEKITMVGGHTAKFIDFLISQGVSRSQLHLIGHSLGAHVIGYASKSVTSGKVPRVTGLDPGLMDIVPETLSTESADFVDVIYTCQGSFSMTESVGHANFFPNGGDSPQPGCGLLGIICSHYEAYRFFVRSINDEQKYLGRECTSMLLLNLGFCNSNPTAYMGIATPSTARGDFYLATETPEIK